MTLLLFSACGDATGPLSIVLHDLDGRDVDPFAGTAQATVFVFTRSDCPIANRYVPELRRLHAEYAERGVRFWLVFVDPHEPAERIREHLRDFDHAMPALRDDRHLLVAAVGARVTPEVAVFGDDRTRRYRGRIDDRYPTLGVLRRDPTVRDLDEAIAALLRGDRIPRPDAPAVGCLIEDLR